jgi:hypothetical protein
MNSDSHAHMIDSRVFKNLMIMQTNWTAVIGKLDISNTLGMWSKMLDL